jgi:hypothetical protein
MTEQKIIDLTPTATGKPVLTPETPVVVINRGYETLVRKFDALDYPLHSHTQGLIRMPYAAALHFQKHTTVPGTRHVESGIEQSYLGIIRTDQPGWPEQIEIDPPYMCEPFTEEECNEFSLRFEAVAREDGEKVEVKSVNKAIMEGKLPVGRGQSSGRGKAGATRTGRTATGKEIDRDEVMAPPDETAEERVDRLNAESEA